MEREKAYRIRELVNQRDQLGGFIANISSGSYIELKFERPFLLGDAFVHLKNDNELYKIIIDYYKQKLAKIDQELENL